MKKILSVLPLLAIFGACSGPTFTKDVKVEVAGMTRDSFGNPKVLRADEDFKICAKISFLGYVAGNTAKADVSLVCVPLVTDSQGAFSVNTVYALAETGVDAIQIKNAKLFVRKISGTSSSSVEERYPVTPKTLEMTDSVIKVKAEVTF